MKTIAQNKKARHDYHIIEEYEAGIVLTGTEVKSLREGRSSLIGSFAKVQGNDIFLVNMHIPEYDKGNIFNHDPLRTRKLLFHKREIKKIIGSLSTKGMAFVPLSIYFGPSGFVKLKMALVKGKKLYDKREDIKKRTQEREIAKAVKRKI